jgi:phosphoserine phosphatase RsbU/P
MTSLQLSNPWRAGDLHSIFTFPEEIGVCRMRLLVGWDAEEELELLCLYLQVDDNIVDLAKSPSDLFNKANENAYDAVLFPITFPDADQSFELFEKLQKLDCTLPVMIANRPGEIYPLSRFIRHGLRSYINRDPDREYFFLLQTLLESTLAAKRAEQTRILAARLREEVESVRKLQESILPRDLRAIPRYQVAARYEPSQIRVSEGQPVVLAGGDYYHVFRLENRRMVALVGDASGHGMKACMSIISMHTLINQFHEHHQRPPHEFVSEINQKLCSDDLITGEGGFITLLYGFVEDDVFHWTSAGHPVPLLHRLDTGEFVELGDAKNDTGAPLGFFEEADYQTISSPIPQHGCVAIYTDGVTEAFPDRPSPPEFGLDGVKRILAQHRESAMKQALSALFEASSAFTEGAGRHDDTSILMFERLT